MDLLDTREGFTKDDYEVFMEVFRKCDRDGQGTLNTKELLSILSWLGFAFDLQQTEAVLQEVDVDRSGTLSEREFLVCMRKVREQEVATAVEAMAASDEDGSG